MQPLILIIDDEKSIRNFLRISLETQGYKCLEAENGANAIMLIASQNPDILVLDLGLPDMDGVDVIRKVRMISPLPIIVVSARGQDREKVEALDAGADDYLTKPFSVPELLARIRVVIRRKVSSGDPDNPNDTPFRIKNLTVDGYKRRIWLDDEEIHLTPNEYKLLSLLIRHRGKVLTHRFLIENV